ncbi:uncharacterized protein LOC125954141 [Anopheles darlingi]|uniref:uncharacterized protein LOC125954141 n=1 Tax=Anopheles darlingi TaxID=43151 RepID=UPI002100246C|nr:uncharacterized protein LOC125954141 [Anopheles darlingi]
MVHVQLIGSASLIRCSSSLNLANLLFNVCEDCGKMACLPQSAFAVHKIRQAGQHEKDLTVARLGGDKQGPRYLNKSTLDLTPVKYNGKLMNSIWGLYNRYSPHNFKKNNGSFGGFFGMQQPFAVACSPVENTTAPLPTKEN